jgi:hypothetical protein
MTIRLTGQLTTYRRCAVSFAPPLMNVTPVSIYGFNSLLTFIQRLDDSLTTNTTTEAKASNKGWEDE